MRRSSAFREKPSRKIISMFCGLMDISALNRKEKFGFFMFCMVANCPQNREMQTGEKVRGKAVLIPPEKAILSLFCTENNCYRASHVLFYQLSAND